MSQMTKSEKRYLKEVSDKHGPHPSLMIVAALEDLHKTIKAGFRIDMEIWVKRSSPTCAACYAGSVMLQSLEALKDDKRSPCDYQGEVQYMLIALNRLRSGFLSSAYSILDREFPEAMTPDRSIPRYDVDPDAWERGMWELADYIQEHDPIRL